MNAWSFRYRPLRKRQEKGQVLSIALFKILNSQLVLHMSHFGPFSNTVRHRVGHMINGQSMKAYYSSIYHLFSILSVKDFSDWKDTFFVQNKYAFRRGPYIFAALKDLKIFERWNWGLKSPIYPPTNMWPKTVFSIFWNLMLLNDQFFPQLQPKNPTIIRIFTRHDVSQLFKFP